MIPPIFWKISGRCSCSSFVVMFWIRLPLIVVPFWAARKIRTHSQARPSNAAAMKLHCGRRFRVRGLLQRGRGPPPARMPGYPSAALPSALHSG